MLCDEVSLSRRLFPVEGLHHLLGNDRWDDKHSGEGKGSAASARGICHRRRWRSSSRCRSREIGRVVLFGIGPTSRARAPGLGAGQGAHDRTVGVVRARREKRFYIMCDPRAGARRSSAHLLVQRRGLPRRRARPVLPLLDRVDGVFVSRLRRGDAPVLAGLSLASAATSTPSSGGDSTTDGRAADHDAKLRGVVGHRAAGLAIELDLRAVRRDPSLPCAPDRATVEFVRACSRAAR